MRAHPRSSRVKRLDRTDERGSALLIALVLIIILAVAGVAVLNQESNATSAQSAYSNLRTVELQVDSAANGLIQGMRKDRLGGVADVAYPGGTAPANAVCPDTTGTKPQLMSNTDPEVFCESTPQSDAPTGASPFPPASAIVTLGGEQPAAGNKYADAIASGPTKWDPFCYDYHDYQLSGGGTSDKCEAGLFVGSNVASGDDSNGDGLSIISTGSLDTSQPLVLSNSSIITSNLGGYKHVLTVSGNVQARYQCGWFTNGAALDLTQIKNTNGGTTSCANSSGPPPQPALVTDPEYKHIPVDPMKLPVIDGAQTASTCAGLTGTTYGNTASCTLSSNLCDGVAGFVEMPARDLTLANPGTPQQTWKDVNGVTHKSDVYGAWYDNAADLNALMQNCPDTFFWFRPGVYYFDFLDLGATAWKSAKGCPVIGGCTAPSDVISELTGGYPGAVWVTSNGVPQNLRPWNDCTPATTTSTPGYPSAALTPGDPVEGQFYQPTAAQVRACAQPEKVMTTEKITVTSGYLPQKDPMRIGDGLESKTSLVGGSNPQDTVTMNNFQSAVPEETTTSGLQHPDVTSIDELKLEVSYSLPDPRGASTGVASTEVYKIPNGDDPAYSPQNTWAGAELQVTIPGVGNCFVHLPTDADSGYRHDLVTNRDTVPVHAAQNTFTGGPATGEVIDLYKGCTWTNPTMLPNQKGFPGFMQNTGTTGFPWRDCTDPAVIAANTCEWTLHPEYINQLKVTFLTVTPSGNATPVEADLDGVQLDVAWHGRPAPSFPGTCDRTGAGVQFILGNNAAINWGNTSSSTGHSMYGELCASNMSQWPGPGAAPIAKYGIAVYGMSEDSAGPVPFMSTDPQKASDSGTLLSHSNSLITPSWSGADLSTANGQYFQSKSAWGTTWPAVASALNTAYGATGMPATIPAAKGPTASDYQTADSNAAIAVWTGSSSAVAKLTFSLPSNLVCSPEPNGFLPNLPARPFDNNSGTTNQCSDDANGVPGSSQNRIPAGSEITNVRVTVKYAEGKWSATTGPVNAPGEITGRQLFVSPGSIATGSNNYQGSTWSTNANTSVNSGGGMPAAGDPTTGYTTFVCGDNTAVLFAPNWDCGGDWTMQRDLTKSLSTPEALQGAQFTWTVTPNSTANIHFAAVDAIVLDVTYRPTGALRPLRGCMTTRTQKIQTTYLPAAANASTTDSSNGTSWNLLATGYDWFDSDWGVNKNVPTISPVSDDAYGNDSGNPNNGSTGDNNDCAAIAIRNTSGWPMKFHASGMLYLPSAALLLTGYDNDAAWASQGIVARQLSALRWQSGGTIPAVGDPEPPTSDRQVVITVCRPGYSATSGGVPVPCAAPNIALRATVDYRDSLGTPGQRVRILSWIRNPTS